MIGHMLSTLLHNKNTILLHVLKGILNTLTQCKKNKTVPVSVVKCQISNFSYISWQKQVTPDEMIMRFTMYHT